MLRKIAPVFLVVLGLTCLSMAADDDAKLSASDKEFVTNAAQGGMMEVMLGKHAAENAASEDVKKFGQKMADDHGKANDELKELASKKGVEVPEKLEKKHQDQLEQLQKLKGDELDKAYMKAMVLDHRADVRNFDRTANGTGDADIKAWAAKLVPVLKEHLKMAEETAKKVGVVVTPPAGDAE